MRALKESDFPEINQLFTDTVHAINAKDYNQEQLSVWAPHERTYEIWKERLKGHIVYVAEKDEQIIGFGDITTEGYLDHLFIHKDFQRHGVASAILLKLEEMARDLGLKELHTEASITAKSFFEKRGFTVVCKQDTKKNGVRFINYMMHKILK